MNKIGSLWRQQWTPIALIAALAGALFAYPMVLGIPLLDPDEGLHASIAQEMVEQGHWIVPTMLGEPFLDKPILYFWAEALSLKLFGMHEAAVRFPGLLFGLLGALSTGFVAARMFGPTTGWLACVFYMTMILPTALAQAAAHDVALIPWINLALLLFWESDRATTWKISARYTAGIGLLLGLTCLTKGLVGIAIVGVSYGLYLLVTRRLTVAACLRGAGSLVIAAGVAMIWYLAVEAQMPGYLHYYFVERHLLGFTTSSQIHGDEPWWYYLPILLGGGLPWLGYLPVVVHDAWANRQAFRKAAATTPTGLAKVEFRAIASPHLELAEDRAGQRDKGRDDRGAMILLWCWLIGCTLFLSISHSKLVTYIWPVFPAVAILAATGWVRMIDGRLSDAAQRTLRWTFLPSCVAGPILLPIVLVVVQSEFDLRFSAFAWTLAVVAALGSWLPMAFWIRRQYRATLAAATGSIAAQFVVIMTVVLPHVAVTTSARNLAQYFNEKGRLPTKLLITEERVGSFVFYLDEYLREGLHEGRVTQAQITRLPTSEPDTLVVLPNRAVNRVANEVDLAGVPFQEAGRYRVYRATDLRPSVLAATSQETSRH